MNVEQNRLSAIIVGGLDGLPEDLHQIVSDRVETLAAIAFEGFLCGGKGMVLFRLDDMSIKYLHRSRVQDPTILEWIHAYDPRGQLVIACARRGEETWGTVITLDNEEAALRAWERQRETISVPLAVKGFLNRYWPWIACGAWCSYRHHGRGVVVLRPDKNPIEEFLYYADIDLIAMPDAHPMRRGAVERAARYDPTKQVVCVYVDGRRAYLYVATGQLTPPEAFQLLTENAYAPVN
ncbi:MAG TPA: hypothetical protein VI756_05385 [Blastocatellia bacterium]